MADMKHLDDIEDIDFETALENSLKDEDTGEIITGILVAINDDVALIDIGQKFEAKIPKSEITDENGELKYNISDSLPVMVTGYKNGYPSISYKKALAKEKAINFIKNNPELEGLVVEGKITKKNKGGYIVENDEAEFFLPKSLSILNEQKDQIGKKVVAIIVKFTEENGNIVISRKDYIKNEKDRINNIINDIMEKNAGIVSGTIKKITSYGMFVDIGGFEGLVHYNEISYKGPVNPATLYKEGEEVEVKMIEWDAKKRHLSLSIKQTMPDPWTEIQEELETGDALEVVVSNIEPYGVFVDLGNDIEAFLHISEISWDKDIKHPKDYLTLGQKLVVEVIEINPKDRKLRVSLKKLQPKPFEEFKDNHKVGDVVNGKVVNITDFGAFIKVDKVEGLLLNSDSSWEKGTKCKDILKVGEEVEVKVSRIDTEKEKVSFDKKSLMDTPVKAFAKANKVDDMVNGTVKDIKDFGVFIEIDKNIDALIRKEDLSPLKADEIEIGQKIEGVISSIDTKTNKIRVSIRKLARKKEKEALSQINDDSKITLADMIKE
jgi:small subunit ribosomal protein S1